VRISINHKPLNEATFSQCIFVADALPVAVNSHRCHYRPLRNSRNDIHTVPQPHCTTKH